MCNTKKIDYHGICNWFSTGFFFDNENFFLKEKDDSLSGSIGDILFDSFEIPRTANIDGQVNKVVDLIVKPGGKEIANELWQYWNLNGSFEQSLNDNIRNKLYDIEIDNPSNCIRAFKTVHYVRNWTNVNMKIFSEYKQVYASYHDSKMRDFICTIPESHLSNRKIQINYIKQKAPELAKIPWQNYDLNLYEYHKFNGRYLPRRGYRYFKRIFREKILRKTPIIQRNWELQFLGEKNDKNLKKWLFESPTLYQIVPKDIVEDYYQKFKKHNSVKYSHPVSMLLTLAVWTTKYLQNK